MAALSICLASAGVLGQAIFSPASFISQVAGRHLEGVRSGAGPALIEARTYRHLGHSKSDPGAYRPPGEVERWKQRDPLIVTRAQLVDELEVPEKDVDAAEQRAREAVADGIAKALAAPYPDPAVDRAMEYAT
jgi:pyruvate dehydrogenase E1 component alpha subunit